MSPTELANFVSDVKAWNDNGLSVNTVPGKPAYFEDVSYWLPDIVALQTEFAARNGLEDTDSIKKRAELAAAKYERELPQELKDGGEQEKSKEKATDKKSPAEETDADDKKDAASDNAKTETPAAENISVMVINSSGINGAGAQVADVLRKKGFIISGVETGKTDQREITTITTAAENTDIFYGMPFTCIILDGGDKNQAVVNIGRDYQNEE